MMRLPRTWPAIACLGVLSAGLLAWLLVLGNRFASLPPKVGMPDSDWNSTPGSIGTLAESLADHAEAADLLRFIHLGPDMVFPVLAAAFFVSLIAKLLPGAVLYGRAVSPAAGRLLLVVPIAYMVADYSENVLSLLFFPPAQPSATVSTLAPVLIPWATRLKFMFFAISAILAVWLALGARRRGQI